VIVSLTLVAIRREWGVRDRARGGSASIARRRAG